LDAGGGQGKKTTDRHNRATGDKRVDPDELETKPKGISRAPTSSSDISRHGERRAEPLQNGVRNVQAKTSQPIINDSASPIKEREGQKPGATIPFAKEHVIIGQR